jgi:hypothetical protein
VPFTQAYLTWEPETQKYEDKITALWRKWRDEPHDANSHSGDEQIKDRLKAIEGLKEEIHAEDVPFEQWEVVYRELLQLQDEVVSGRVQRGEAPAKSSKNDVESAESAVGTGGKPNKKSKTGAGETTKGSPTKPAWTELAIVGLLVMILASWRNRD